MTRQELFQQEKEALEQEQKAREERKNFTPFKYENIDYAPINKGLNVFRFYGYPIHARQECYDPKVVATSKIKDDKGGQFTCHWPDDPDWILFRIYKKVASCTFDKNQLNDEGKPGKKVYNYAVDYPKMLDRCLHNNEEGHLYEGRMLQNPGWYPKYSVYFNVLDRSDYAWHKEHKSWKLIAKKVNEAEDKKGNKRLFAESGIAKGTYDLLANAIAQENGDWQDFDVAIEKLTVLPFYKIYSFQDERKIHNDLVKLGITMNGEKLTDEELSWKKFDIDKITPITRYKTIMNRLGKFIKEVDANLETNFYSELEELVAKEKEELAAKKDSSQEEDTEICDNDEDTDNTVEESPISKVENPVETKPVARTRTPVASNITAKDDIFEKAKSIQWTDKKGNVHKGWEGIDKYKAKYIKFTSNIADNSIIYKDSTGKDISNDDTRILTCSECGLPMSEDVLICPRCGTEYSA